MNQHDEIIEFDLKALFFYVLRQWKPVLIFGLVIALLLGSMKGYQEYKTGVDVNPAADYWVEYQRYEDQLTLYRDQISTTQVKINTLQDYIDHSVLMKADPRNIYIAKATYYIDTDYKILPENTFQTPNKAPTLAWYYQNYLQDYNVYVEIGEEIGLEAKYLMELITVSTVNDETLAISVFHPDEASARNIMEILQRNLQEVHAHLEDAVHAHEMTVMMNTCGVYIDDALSNTQQKVYDELLDYQDDIIKLRQQLHALEKEGGPGELNAVNKFIKWFIVGSVLGAVLAAGCYFVLAILRNRVMAPSQLISSYQLPVLGEVVRDSAAKDPIGKLLNKWEGRLPENTQANMLFVAENIRNHCSGISHILVTSDISREESEKFAASMKDILPEIRFTPVGSLLKDAQALQTLRECDSVLALISRDHTSNAAIAKELQLVRECSKAMLGFIFIG